MIENQDRRLENGRTSQETIRLGFKNFFDDQNHDAAHLNHEDDFRSHDALHLSHESTFEITMAHI